MLSREEVEGYVAKLGDGSVEYEVIEENEEEGTALYLVSVEGEDAKVVINLDPPVVVMRVNVMDMPKGADARALLMKKVLELNVEDLLHGSYGLEGEHIVITAAHELENLDFSEFQATFDSIMLALASHVPVLAKHGEA